MLGILLLVILAFTATIGVSAEDTKRLTCEGTMIEPAAMSQSPETAKLAIGPDRKVSLDLGKGTMKVSVLSDNKIQLKFRTKDFEAEYFHYTGDLFFIYKSGHLMRLICKPV
jgi:hypothetical protein